MLTVTSQELSFIDVFHNFSKIIVMKRLLLILAVLSLCRLVTGQEPESFVYKTVVRNIAGDPVVSKIVSIRVVIVSGDKPDAVIYSELHHTETDQQGSVSINIGEGSDKNGDFESIDWNSKKYFLKIDTDVTGGSDYKNELTIQILVVPYMLPPGKLKKPSEDILEDKLFLSRKYAGKFIEYRHTGLSTFNSPNLIWIKTSKESIFGKISAYGKKCGFSVGDNLYLKRTYYNPGGISGYWDYQIENDSSVYYRLTEFQHDRKIAIETWFR